jgi:Domain of unknown function (DUF4166)
VGDGGQPDVALYRRLLGARFEALPARVRELHDVTGTAVWVGRADVERGASWASRLLAALFSLPPDGKEQLLRVTFEPRNGREIWTRAFGLREFRSVQLEKHGLLRERVGLSCLVFALDASLEGLALRLLDVLVLGVSLPRMLHPCVRTMESEVDGRYRFEVSSHLPLIGLLVRYAGWLERVDTPASA